MRLLLEHGVVAIYTRQKNRVFEAAMNGGRNRFGNCDMVSRQEGTRKALKAMKAGRFFHYSPDMDYGPKESVFVPFFGVQTATITGLARLAKLTGATVIPLVTRMESRGWQTRYVASVGEPWAEFPGDGETGRRAAPECLHRARSIEVAGAVLLAAQALQDPSAGEQGVY
jgi:KDO2-lipid IV(A) lauroyltransferase